MGGLSAARSAMTQWASGAVPQTELLGLVIVADAPGRLPKPLRDFSELVAGGVPRVWNVEWIEAWRMGEPPNQRDARSVQHLIDDLHALIQFGAEGTT